MLAILSSAKTTRIICAQMAVHGFDILWKFTAKKPKKRQGVIEQIGTYFKLGLGVDILSSF